LNYLQAFFPADQVIVVVCVEVDLVMEVARGGEREDRYGVRVVLSRLYRELCEGEGVPRS
jgi:hypothetical protein